MGIGDVRAELCQLSEIDKWAEKTEKTLNDVDTLLVDVATLAKDAVPNRERLQEIINTILEIQTKLDEI